MKQFLLGLLFLLISAIFLSAFVIANAVGNGETDSVYLIIILSVVSFIFGIFMLVFSRNDN